MHYLLFTTGRCMKCPGFKEFVSKHIEFSGKILDDTMPEFSAQAQDYGVTMAPTILIFSQMDQLLLKTSEISELQDFLLLHNRLS